MEIVNKYIDEIQLQIEFAKRAYSDFSTVVQKRENLSAFYHAHHFLIHAVNIGKIIDSKPGSQRERLLNPIMRPCKFDIKAFRRLRNQLEHFDERLDQWVQERSQDTFFDMNLVTGAKGFPHFAALRAIDGKTFFFQGVAYDLEVLHHEICDLSIILSEDTNSQ